MAEILVCYLCLITLFFLNTHFTCNITHCLMIVRVGRPRSTRSRKPSSRSGRSASMRSPMRASLGSWRIASTRYNRPPTPSSPPTRPLLHSPRCAQAWNIFGAPGAILALWAMERYGLRASLLSGMFTQAWLPAAPSSLPAWCCAISTLPPNPAVAHPCSCAAPASPGSLAPHASCRPPPPSRCSTSPSAAARWASHCCSTTWRASRATGSRRSTVTQL